MTRYFCFMCFVYVLVYDVAFLLMDLFCNRKRAKNSCGAEKPSNTGKVRLGQLRLLLNAALCRIQKETRKRPLASAKNICTKGVCRS